MTFRAQPPHERRDATVSDERPPPQCPPLIELAALAEQARRGLADENDDHLIAHIAGCAHCLEAVRAIHRDVAEVESDASMLIVPASILNAAMALRSADAHDEAATAVVHVLARSPSWVRFMRRSAAIAACAGLALAGHSIGAAFAVAGQSPIDRETLAFGLLDDGAGESGSEFDLSALLIPIADEVEAQR